MVRWLIVLVQVAVVIAVLEIHVYGQFSVALLAVGGGYGARHRDLGRVVDW